MRLERTLVHCTSGGYFIATVVLASNKGSFNNSDGQLCTFITLFGTFHSRNSTATAWNLLSQGMEDTDRRQLFFLFLNLRLNPMNPTPNSPTLVILNEMAWSQRLRKRKSISPLIRTFSLSSQWTTGTATNQSHSYSYEGCSKKKTFPLYNYKNDATELYFLSSPMVTLNSIQCASSTAHSQ